MKKVLITIEDYLYAFYKKVGESAEGMPPEQVMVDALFKFAGDVSRNIINEEAQKHVGRGIDRRI